MAFTRSYYYQGDPLRFTTMRAGVLWPRMAGQFVRPPRAPRASAVRLAMSPGLAAAFTRRGGYTPRSGWIPPRRVNDAAPILRGIEYAGDPFKFGKFFKRIVKPPQALRKMFKQVTFKNVAGAALGTAKLGVQVAPFVPGLGTALAGSKGLIGAAFRFGSKIAPLAGALLPQPSQAMPTPPADEPVFHGPVGQVVAEARPEEFDFSSLTPRQLLALLMWAGIEVPGVTTPEVE